MDNEKHVLDLISYRVLGSSGICYMDKKLSADEIIKRRAAMRKILMNSRFNNSSNDALDSMRIVKAASYYTVEDSEGYEIVIGFILKKAPNNAENIDKGQRH